MTHNDTQWLEKDLELYLLDNIRVLSSAVCFSDLESFVCLGRQIRCQFGIIDLLCTWKNTIMVIEVKNETATERTVGQVHRYIELITHIADPYQYMSPSVFSAAGEYANLNMCPVIIAPRFDPNVFKSNCLLIQAEHLESGEFDLRRATPPVFAKQQNADLEKALEPFMRGIAGHAIGTILEKNKRQLEVVSVFCN